MTVKNIYYNIVNDMEPTKGNSLSTEKPSITKPASTKTDFTLPEGLLKNSVYITVGAGVLLGLGLSFVTRKNYILNPLLGGLIGYAGNEFALKGKLKKTKKSE